MRGEKPYCFQSNGDLEPDFDYQPCNQIPGQPSMCCATNRTVLAGEIPNGSGNNLTVDLCVQNGLCRNDIVVNGGQVKTRYWREDCSVNEWNTDQCLNVCLNAVCF